jgi:hypothetical protein
MIFSFQDPISNILPCSKGMKGFLLCGLPYSGDFILPLSGAKHVWPGDYIIDVSWALRKERKTGVMNIHPGGWVDLWKSIS